MNSHIQFPKSLLKKFTDKNNWLHYYDFRDKTIKCGRAKTFNTEAGYYSEIVEKFFSDKIETHIGNIIKQIEADSFDEKVPIKDFVDHSRDYIYSLISRNPDMITETRNNSVYLRFMSKIDIRSFVASETLVLAHNADLLGSFPLGIGTSEGSLVLNSRGMIQCNNTLYCPVTPKRALVIPLLKNPEYEDCIPVFDLTAETETINAYSFVYEKMFGKRYVIANSAKQLRSLLDEYDS